MCNDSVRATKAGKMGIMKELYSKLIEAFPSSCPHCQAELCDFIDFGKLNEVIDQITLIERINAERGKEGCEVSGEER